MMIKWCKRTILWERALLLIGIVFVISGCTTDPDAIKANQTRVHASPTPLPTLLPTPQPPSSSIGVTFQIEDLLYIWGMPTIKCLPSPYGSLVLATDRLLYDQAEMQQMITYIDTLNTSDHPPLPSTLEYLPGSATQDMLAPKSDEPGITTCSTFFEVTNMNKEPIQISKIVLRYINDAAPNSFKYRLINLCSIGKWTQNVYPYVCPSASGGRDWVYKSEFNVEMKPHGTVYSSTLYTPETGHVIPVLQPGQVIAIDMFITIKNLQSGLLVTAVPEIVVESVGGSHTLKIDPMKMQIGLAAPENVSCYALKGTTFVEQEGVNGMTKQGLPSQCI